MHTDRMTKWLAELPAEFFLYNNREEWAVNGERSGMVSLLPIEGDRLGYYAGDDGKIYTTYAGHGGPTARPWTIPPKELRGGPDPNGYRRVFLGAGHSHTVHSLICKTFHGPRPAKLEASHLDGIPLNTRPSNLIWETHQENHESCW